MDYRYENKYINEKIRNIFNLREGDTSWRNPETTKEKIWHFCLYMLKSYVAWDFKLKETTQKNMEKMLVATC